MRYTIAVLVLIVLGGTAFAVFGGDVPQDPPDGESNQPAVEPTGVVHEIVLTEDGFDPANIEIGLGDEIVFTTTRDELFWPASNVHPTHRLYPAFDPEEPIDSDASWSFVFDQTGEWRFHDHLSPIFTGVITVVEE